MILNSVLLTAALAAGDGSFAERLNAALAADIRTEADTARDANRQPLATLEFFGVSSDQKVLELVPGRGWYTKVLAPAIDDFHISIGGTWVIDNLISEKGYDHINVIEPQGMEMARSAEFNLRTINGPFSFGETGFDVILTFRNLHNFDEAGRRHLNAAVFDALAPGGVYGVVDHTRRHMEPITSENRRRADPVEMIKEIQDAGLVLEDYTALHYKPGDELTLEVGNDAVTGRTDRFTFKFRKPAN
ncbi:MAG: methyltransferase [Pseudomonadota bacterium]